MHLSASVHSPKTPLTRYMQESDAPRTCLSPLPTSQMTVSMPGKRQKAHIHARARARLCTSPSWPSQSGSGDVSGFGRIAAFAFQGSFQGEEAQELRDVTVPYFLVSRIPGVPTRPPRRINVSLCTVFHIAAAHLGLELPWPISGSSPRHAGSNNTRVSGAPARAWASAPCRSFLRRWGYTSCSRRRERQARGVSSFLAPILSVLVRSRTPPGIHRNSNIPVHKVVHGIRPNLAVPQIISTAQYVPAKPAPGQTHEVSMSLVKSSQSSGRA